MHCTTAIKCILDIFLTPLVILSNLCAVAEADDSDSGSSSVDIQLLNHIIDKAKLVRLKIIVVHIACRVNQKQYVSLLPAWFFWFLA